MFPSGPPIPRSFHPSEGGCIQIGYRGRGCVLYPFISYTPGLSQFAPSYPFPLYPFPCPCPCPPSLCTPSQAPSLYPPSSLPFPLPSPLSPPSLQQSGTIWLIHNGQRREFPSWDTFVNMGYTVDKHGMCMCAPKVYCM